MPLGNAFVDGFTRATAQEDIDAAQTLEYTLRFVEATAPPLEPALSVAQDRRFNAVEETSAFLAGEGIVISSGAYEISAAHPHGRIALVVRDPNSVGDSKAGSDARRDAGQSSIELCIEWAAWDADASAGAFVTSELAIQRVTLPPDEYFDQAAIDTSYLEIITRFEKPTVSVGSASGTAAQRRPRTIVKARNRLVQYLALPGVETPSAGQPSSSRARGLERLAAGRAVSFFDYDWVMEKIEEDQGSSSSLGTPLRA